MGQPRLLTNLIVHAHTHSPQGSWYNPNHLSFPPAGLRVIERPAQLKFLKKWESICPIGHHLPIA